MYALLDINFLCALQIRVQWVPIVYYTTKFLEMQHFIPFEMVNSTNACRLAAFFTLFKLVRSK